MAKYWPTKWKETLQHRNLILVLLKSVGISPLSIPTGRDSSPYNSQILYSKFKIASGQNSKINLIYLQIKNVFKKISCLNPFLPWLEIQGTGLPPAPEELHLPAHSHASNGRETSNHITAWELYMKQNLLQLVIHMLFLWPNSGNGIPKACFQKHSCAFPKKSPMFINLSCNAVRYILSTGFSFLFFFLNNLPNYQRYLLHRS